MGVGGQSHAPAALPPGRSGRVRKISPPPRLDPRIDQPVASRYTDWADRTYYLLMSCLFIYAYASIIQKLFSPPLLRRYV